MEIGSSTCLMRRRKMRYIGLNSNNSSSRTKEGRISRITFYEGEDVSILQECHLRGVWTGRTFVGGLNTLAQLVPVMTVHTRIHRRTWRIYQSFSTISFIDIPPSMTAFC